VRDYITPYKLIITLASLAVLALTMLPVFDDIGKDYTDESLKRALVTFGVARGLNGVISVAQGTEVAMEPAGVGVIFAPGQILDPVNDLVERFSWVMLVSATSLGIQALLQTIFSSPGFIVLAATAIVLALIVGWWPRVSSLWRTRLIRVAAMMVVLRFMIPLLAVCSEGFYQLFLAAGYASSSHYLTQTSETLGRLNDEGKNDVSMNGDASWYDMLRHNFDSTLNSLNIDQHVEALQLAVQHLTEHTINLIVIFTVQTIIFPLFFLYLASRGIKALLRI